MVAALKLYPGTEILTATPPHFFLMPPTPDSLYATPVHTTFPSADPKVSGCEQKPVL